MYFARKLVTAFNIFMLSFNHKKNQNLQIKIYLFSFIFNIEISGLRMETLHQNERDMFNNMWKWNHILDSRKEGGEIQWRNL